MARSRHLSRILETRINNLFNIFKRFHTHVDGAGIGLYIVKSLVESRGGYVEVESEINKGTVFKIFIIPQQLDDSLACD